MNWSQGLRRQILSKSKFWCQGICLVSCSVYHTGDAMDDQVAGLLLSCEAVAEVEVMNQTLSSSLS